MRKGNENFKKIYEGNNNNYSINNLIIGTNYEFIIYSFYNNNNNNKNLIESKSEIYAFRAFDNIDSNILNESKRYYEFCNKLYQWKRYKKMKLIYRGSRDGDSSKNFHEKCDNQGPTITLIKNEKGNIFGGFSSISWTSQGDHKKDLIHFYLVYQIFMEQIQLNFNLKIIMIHLQFMMVHLMDLFLVVDMIYI
jgi:hypothetical protein